MTAMTDASETGNIVADRMMARPSAEERDEIARQFLGYSLGALAALHGKERAAEIAYRFADAMVSLKSDGDQG